MEKDIDEIIEDIIEGLTFRKISEKRGIALSTLHDFCSKPEHSARVRLALELSAQTYDEKAEEVLIDAISDRTEIQRARELSQLYRWRAAKRNPKKYGERQEVEMKVSGEIKPIIEFGDDDE